MGATEKEEAVVIHQYQTINIKIRDLAKAAKKAKKEWDVIELTVKIKTKQKQGFKEVASKPKTKDSENQQGALGTREIHLKKKLKVLLAGQKPFAALVKKHIEDAATAEKDAANARIKERMARLKNSRQGTPWTKEAYEKAKAATLAARDNVIKSKQIVDEDA